jgi:hypothetical protein
MIGAGASIRQAGSDFLPAASPDFPENDIILSAMSPAASRPQRQVIKPRARGNRVSDCNRVCGRRFTSPGGITHFTVGAQRLGPKRGTHMLLLLHRMPVPVAGPWGPFFPPSCRGPGVSPGCSAQSAPDGEVAKSELGQRRNIRCVDVKAAWRARKPGHEARAHIGGASCRHVVEARSSAAAVTLSRGVPAIA